MNSLKVCVYCFFLLFLSTFVFSCSKVPSVKVEQIYLTDFVVEGDQIKTRLNLVFFNESKTSFSFRITDVSANLNGKDLPMKIDDAWQKVEASSKSHVKLDASMRGRDILQYSLQQGLSSFLSNDPFDLEFGSKLHLRKGVLTTKVDLKRSFQFTLNDVIANTKRSR